MDLKQVAADKLDEVRRRSLALLEPISDEDQVLQHSPLMSPLVWDLAHVGNYEEIWLLRTIAGVPVRPQLDDIYDAFKHARKERTRLPLLGPREARTYISEVRDKVFDVLEMVDLDDDNPLLRDAFIYGMVVQHEHQHDETMLASLQLRARDYPLDEQPTPLGRAVSPGEVLVPAGPFTMGTDIEPWAYDNERPAHVIDLPPFYIDTVPVSNANYVEFMLAGGYDEPRYWSDQGWAWRIEEGLEHPQFWVKESGGWFRNRFGRSENLPLNEPVQHVCYYEAEAYATWAGKRLPTEAEWEKAASWDPMTDTKRRFPWGNEEPTDIHANLGERSYRPSEIGAYPQGASAYGCEQMIGDVWEWTTSDFLAHPGFVSFPYCEYSEVFFGRDFKVLRGGSWATHPSATRTTFRNWDFPIRRQIFCGFRCARDA